MEAISDFVDVIDKKIQYQLPNNFNAQKVQLIILPIENQQYKKKRNRILSLKGSIVGVEADSLENHVKSIRNEW